MQPRRASRTRRRPRRGRVAPALAGALASLALASAPALAPRTADASELLRGLVAAQSAGEPAVAHRVAIEEGRLATTYDLRLAAADGRTWRYFVREPRRDARSLAAVLVLAGVETGRASLRFVAERDDMVVLAMDYPFHGAEQLGGFDLLRALPSLRRQAFEAVEAAALGVTYLARRPDVDPARIVVLGVSLGGIFAVALGAHDPRASAVVLIYGGGDLGSLARRNLAATPWWMPSFVVGPLVRAYFGELEPLAHVALIAPRFLLMAASRQDEMIPPSAARELFARAGEPKKLLWYATGHMDLFEPALLRRLTDDVIAELEATGHLAARRAGGERAAPP